MLFLPSVRLLLFEVENLTFLWHAENEIASAKSTLWRCSADFKQPFLQKIANILASFNVHEDYCYNA